MDARVCARPGCGNPLLPGRMLEDFCTYACRGQHRALEATSGASGLIRSKNAKQNKALQSLRRQSVGRFSFTRLNPCTHRLDRPGKLGAGWLIEVSPCGARERWVARVGNRASETLTLAEAKRAAIAMLREHGKVKLRDWIADLNKIAAAEIDRVALAKDRQRWPCNLLGGQSASDSSLLDRKLRDAILNAELLAMPSHPAPPSGDAFRLEFYDDGYPKLPECLRRRARYER
jgi:hypothetical protein